MDKESFTKRIRRQLFGLLHPGDKYCCAFCNSTFNKFLPGGAKSEEALALSAIGIGYRENARCPKCGSNDRTRLLALYLKATGVLEKRNLKVLDIGPDRHLASLIKSNPNADYTCGSIFPEDYSDLGGIKIDVTEIPFANNYFDLLICNHVLQQVPDDKKAMREIARVLKNTGIAIVQVPLSTKLPETIEDLTLSDKTERRRRFGSTEHIRLYGQDYSARLLSQGLIAKPTHPVRDGWCKTANRYAVIEEEQVWVLSRLLT